MPNVTEMASRRTGESHGDGLTVVLADYHVTTREHIRRALEDRGFVVAAEAGTARQAVAEVLRHRPQICLLAIDLVGLSIGAIEQIAAERPDTRIAVLAESSGERRVLRAIRAGADGVLLTATPPEQLTAGVRALARGEQPPAGSVSAHDARGKLSSVSSVLLYVPRFVRHLYRRLRSRMSLSAAWTSSRARMQRYR